MGVRGHIGSASDVQQQELTGYISGDNGEKYYIGTPEYDAYVKKLREESIRKNITNTQGIKRILRDAGLYDNQEQPDPVEKKSRAQTMLHWIVEAIHGR